MRSSVQIGRINTLYYDIETGTRNFYLLKIFMF